jgi:hypothetical protein
MTVTDQAAGKGIAPPGKSEDAPELGHSGGDIRLIPGTTIADGSIRLLIFQGGLRHLQFWQAADTATGRQLAVTLIDPDGALPAGTVDASLARTARLRGIEMPGLARVIDVGRDHCGGVVVSEWIRGGTLKEVADTKPSPIGVADAVQSLTEAAEAAHRAGLVLSVDHPARVRVSTHGDVVLAFPATMTDATPHDDLRGIGAVMYALLVNRWPFGEQDAVNEWDRVELDADGRPEEPASLNSQVPFLISATAAGLVREVGIRSAETVSTLLREASEEAKKGAPNSARELPALPPPGCYARFRNFGPTEQVEFARRQLLKAFLGTAAAVVVVVLMMFASTFSRILGSGETNVAATADKLGLHTPSPTLSLRAPQAAPAPVVTAGPVKPLKASVFSPGGSPDNPNSAGLSIDGDPATAWSTDTYFDAVPFPKFKDGVGLLLQLPQPTSLSAVTVDLDSIGTVVEIRSSPSPTPAKLSDTTELSRPTPMQPGHNSIPVNNPAPTTNVLVWISTLGSVGGKSHADISEVTLQTVIPRG